MTNPKKWIELRDQLEARGEDETLPLEARIHALAQLAFHYGQDRQGAAKALRRIEDLAGPNPAKRRA